MSQVRVSGNASGTGIITVTSPNTNTNYTQTLPAATGDLVSTGDTGTVTSTMLATAATPIGVGQTWQNVTSSRAIGTTYTNSTGRPIMVIVSGTGGGANGLWGVTLNSAISYYTPSTYTTNVWTACEFIVPAGNTYQLSQQGSSVTLQNWSELR